MKIITWNVNGLRAVLNKDFMKIFDTLTPDVLCLQETKLQSNQIPKELVDGEFLKETIKEIGETNLKNNFLSIKTINNYNSYWHFSIKKGYSGVATLSKNEPISVKYGIGDDDIDSEGRSITLEFKDFYIVNCYVPNAQPELKRIDFRLNYENKLSKYLKKLENNKPIIYLGDLNVAHEEIDLKNPKQNIGNPGFSDEERNAFSKLLDKGFIDVYREVNPEGRDYTWWSYRMNARNKDIGWRIDYFVISKVLLKKVKSIIVHKDIMGSDHCPVELNIS